MAREARGKHYGTIVLAEGLAELLPTTFVAGIGRDEHGHLSIGKVDIGKLVAKVAGERYEQRTGKLQEAHRRPARLRVPLREPHAFDVMLGCQLGLGAYRALVEEGLDGHMVSVAAGQLDLRYVPFRDLINQETLKTEVRFIERGSDFHKLARALEDTPPSHLTMAVRRPRRARGRARRTPSPGSPAPGLGAPPSPWAPAPGTP